MAARTARVTSLVLVYRHEDVLGASAVRHDPDNFLKHPRPSMLKDYFDPELRKILSVHRRLKQIMVKIHVEEAYVPGI